MAGLMSAGRQLASKGRMGDSILAHINPREAALLMAHGGMGTRNPKTGLMEFWSLDDWLSMFGGGEVVRQAMRDGRLHRFIEMPLISR